MGRGTADETEIVAFSIGCQGAAPFSNPVFLTKQASGQYCTPAIPASARCTRANAFTRKRAKISTDCDTVLCLQNNLDWTYLHKDYVELVAPLVFVDKQSRNELVLP
jgi:hypothetical protein